MGKVKSKYLLDTVILIDHLAGRLEATRWLQELKVEGTGFISVVTRAETLAGGDPARRDFVINLLDEWPCLPINMEVADLAATLRREHRWKLPDAFQAALAQHHGLYLATRNTRDFPEEKFDFVKTPYRVP